MASLINQKLHVLHHKCEFNFLEDCLPDKVFPLHNRKVRVRGVHLKTKVQPITCQVLTRKIFGDFYLFFYCRWLHGVMLNQISAPFLRRQLKYNLNYKLVTVALISPKKGQRLDNAEHVEWKNTTWPSIGLRRRRNFTGEKVHVWPETLRPQPPNLRRRMNA